MKLLATADIHIGRRPARLPRVAAAVHSSARIWERVVDLAIQEEVAAVLISGDLVDADNRFFEAVGALEAGLDRLQAADIMVYAVTGNHDWETLPSLADSLSHPALHLLGRRGRWEKAVIHAAGQDVTLLGWSFPAGHVRTSALPEFPPAFHSQSDTPSIGLLHADLDVAGSPYHPVTTAELRSLPIDAWLVGHVHASLGCSAKSFPYILRLGSPQGLDPGPGEQGWHGPWLLDVGGAGGFQFSQASVAGVQYETIPVDLSGIASAADLQAHLAGELKEHIATLADSNPQLEAVVCRLVLEGAPDLHAAEIRSQCNSLLETGLESSRIQVLVEKISMNFHIPLDLKEYQDEPGILGVLAQLIGELEQGRIPAQLREQTLSGLGQIENAPVFMPLSSDAAEESGSLGTTAEEASELLLVQARRLLYALVEQRRGAP